MRSRYLLTSTFAVMADATWSRTWSVALRFKMKRGLSVRCWIFGHDDWLRRASGRVYLECLDCGRQTPGWTTARDQTGADLHNRCGSESIGSPIGTSARHEAPRHQGDMPMAA